MGQGQALNSLALLIRVAGCLAGLAAESKVAKVAMKRGREQLATVALRGWTLLRWGRQEHLCHLLENTDQ